MQLIQLQNGIAEKQNTLSTQVNAVQLEVEALRRLASSQRRLADEQTLGIEQLKSRLKSWKDQSYYQHNLIIMSATNANAPAEILTTLEASSAQSINYFSDNIESLFSPNTFLWTSSDIITETGYVKQFERLSLGPVTWFYDSTRSEAGLLTLENETYRVSYTFDNKQSSRDQ